MPLRPHISPQDSGEGESIKITMMLLHSGGPTLHVQPHRHSARVAVCQHARKSARGETSAPSSSLFFYMTASQLWSWQISGDRHPQDPCWTLDIKGLGRTLDLMREECVLMLQRLTFANQQDSLSSPVHSNSRPSQIPSVAYHAHGVW